MMERTSGRNDSPESEAAFLSTNNNEVTLNGATAWPRTYGSVVVMPDDGDRRKRGGRWPSMLWVMFTFLSLFWHRNIVKRRKCYTCYATQATRRSHLAMKNESLLLDPLSLEYEYDGDEWQNENGISDNGNVGTEDDIAKECDVCNVTWCDYYGLWRRYTDKEIGVSSWVFCGSKVTSFCWLIVTLGLILFEVGYYMEKMWGRQKKLLHFISYNAFLICISLYPIMSLFSRLRSFCGRMENVPFLEWASSLNARFIVKRLQVLNLTEGGLPGKFVFFISSVWPLLNSGLRAYIYIVLIKHNLDLHSKISICSTAVLLSMWGCLVYLIYVMRLSFQRQLMLTLGFLRRNEGALDLCRNTLSHVVLDFNCFRRFTVIYMATMIPLTVLGVTTNVSWQYRLAGSCYKQEDPAIEMSINILIWSNIIMLISLSVIAIGGLDLNYVWAHFSISVIQMQSFEQGPFWSKIISHVRNMGSQQPMMSLTMVWSIIGFYMGIHLGDDQDVFYGGTMCHEVNLTEAKAKAVIGYTAMY